MLITLWYFGIYGSFRRYYIFLETFIIIYIRSNLFLIEKIGLLLYLWIILWVLINGVTAQTVCADGWYPINDTCQPCDTSCRTCTTIGQCTSCESFMSLNSTTLLCQHWPDGEYFDETSQVCRSCGSSCVYKCQYQTSCFECPAGQYLDLDTLTCVNQCDVSKITLNNTQYTINSVWRSLEFYVDPQSSEVMEFGTK